MTEGKKPQLLTLPPEIREHIYRLIFHPDANRLYEPDEYTDYDYSAGLVLSRINQQIYYESRKVFRDLNVFVRIETPWPEAQDHVAFEGHVPVLVKDERATKFTGHSLSVIIDAPQNVTDETRTKHFVILRDDLEKFAKTWFYANLSHPGLNRYLRLTLQLRDPYTPSWEEKRMPKALQRQLILPFGMVRDLNEVVLTGDPKPFASIEAELREAMKVPHKSAEHCLREATRLKVEGNDELTKGNYATALRLYTEAWEALHVVVKGRKRHIHADAFYSRELLEDPFKGKNGQSERLILRVQLVANTTQVYLKMEDWEEASFWGMRSINMLREAMGADERHEIPAEDEAVLGFPGCGPDGKDLLSDCVGVQRAG